MTRTISRLDVLVEEYESGERVCTLLIDGEDLFGGDEDRYGGIGLDPRLVLTPEPPLLATATPRRVSLCRCGCGNWEDGNVTALIYEQDGVVYWDDIRSMPGVFRGPETVDSWVDESKVSDPDFANKHGDESLDFPDLGFDADQYREEVRRAATAFSVSY
jgi:hypothetical protein